MDSGNLRHFVSFQSLLVTLDAEGAQTEAWLDEFDGQLVPADIAPLSGRELLAASAVNSKTATRITIRYMPGILTSWRIVHRETAYNIESVIPDPKTGIESITLMCSSGTNAG